MRRLASWLIAAVFALVLAAVLLLALAVEREPRVPRRDQVSPADVDRAVAVLRQNDPRRSPPGRLRSLRLSERDLDLLVQHGARHWLGVDTQLQLRPGRLLAQASLPAPWGRWLNVELVLRQTAAAPEVERLQIGRLPLPAALALPVMRSLAARRGLQPEVLLAMRWVESVSIGPDAVAVRYRVDPDAVSRLRAALVAPQDQRRLRAYQERLAELTRDSAGQTRSVATLLSPLFSLAVERTAQGGDAAAENRAALLTLSFYANQRPLGMLVPAAYQWPRPWPAVVELKQRQDFALHFLISAVIAAEAGTPLADAVGLWKELADARSGGSGFSFNDLAADRAGTRFGELAVGDPTRLQQRIAAGVSDADLLPQVSDLPEHLPEAEFVARYGGVGGAGYQRLLASIESRIDALPVFQ
ncbi:MAG: hypothetical protein MUF08_05665 [Burkholderiaceae bacterium]|jgi:hypothetical protein|nr:hypothetical protein [Burkholderiaceae bacterium]